MRSTTLTLGLVLSVAFVAGCTGRPPDDATGEEVYQQLCANCHGSDLQGGVAGPPLGPGSNSSDASDEYLETTILDGRGRMPSFSTSLDSAQLQRLIAFLRSEHSG